MYDKFKDKKTNVKVEVFKLFDTYDIEDLLYTFQTKENELASIVAYEEESKGEVNLDVRNTKIYKEDSLSFPDISSKLSSLINLFDDKPENYIPIELNFLEYEIGSKFIKHNDDSYNPYARQRRYTTVTMLEKSDDLIGGDLIVDDKDVVNLQVGETIIFKSNTFHEVTEVLKGNRKVLVCWIHNKY